MRSTRGLLSIGAVLIAVGIGSWLLAHAASRGGAPIDHPRSAACFRRALPHGVVALGDSITVGSSAPARGLMGPTSWFSHAVCNDEIPYTYNAGVNGQDAGEIAARVDDVIARKPKVVVLLAGTNDILRDEPLPPAVASVGATVRRLRTAGITPVLGTLPPLASGWRRVRAFNAALRRLAGAQAVALIDFNRVLASHDGYRSGLTTDGVHPSPRGAEAMAAAAAPVLRRALRTP